MSELTAEELFEKRKIEMLKEQLTSDISEIDFKIQRLNRAREIIDDYLVSEGNIQDQVNNHKKSGKYGEWKGNRFSEYQEDIKELHRELKTYRSAMKSWRKSVTGEISSLKHQRFSKKLQLSVL